MMTKTAVTLYGCGYGWQDIIYYCVAGWDTKCRIIFSESLLLYHYVSLILCTVGPVVA